jgi:ribonuclease BN (tRNA processing enzyme)
MKLTILGCSGGYPAKGGATTGYLVQISGKNILIDCGSGVLSNLFKYISLEQIDAVIVTHLHADHMSDILVLKYALQMNKQNGLDIHPIPLFCPVTPETVLDQLLNDTNLVVGHINSSTELPLFGAVATFYRTNHPVECYGVRIEHEGRTLSFSADAVYGQELIPLFQDADLGIMDCGSLEKSRKPVMLHMTPGDCFRLYQECAIKKVVLSHLVPYYSISDIEDEARQYGPWPYVIAEIGLSFDVT